MTIDKNNITTIIFDWGGVCCEEGEPFASKKLQEKVDKHPDNICKDVMNLYLDFYRGKYTADEFYSNVISHYNLEENENLNPKEMADAYIDSTKIWYDILDVVKKLQNNHNVGLLSDLTPVMKECIQNEVNITDYFPTEMYSCDQGINIIKVDGPKIFEIMMDRMNVDDPQKCLFIDNSKSKIEVARKFGMQTMLFENKEQFFEDIKHFL